MKSEEDEVVNETLSSNMSSMLPEKSRYRYEQAYEKYLRWCKKHAINTHNESALMAYFSQISQGSMWAMYSMIKSCLIIQKKIDISKYTRLSALLKRQTAHHAPKKSKVIDQMQAAQFIAEAPDDTFLMAKVALIMGISGACKRHELCSMLMRHVDTTNTNVIIVNLPSSKTNLPRKFIITKNAWIELVIKYIKLRPTRCESDRFFLTYRDGKCIKSPVGINTMGHLPMKIAEFLKLPDPKGYTGHCFRRSSGKLYANQGGDLVPVRKRRCYKTQTDIVESSEDEAPASVPKPSESVSESVSEKLVKTNTENTTSATVTGDIGLTEEKQLANLLPGIYISNCSTCSINVKIYKNCTVTSSEAAVNAPTNNLE